MNVITYLSKRILGEGTAKATKDELTLQFWELWITEGVEAAVRGRFHKITEIYVPELNLAINKTNSPVIVFLCDYDRYTSKNESMPGRTPKLAKTVIISKKSEASKTLLWLKEVYTKKKEMEATLIKLFE